MFSDVPEMFSDDPEMFSDVPEMFSDVLSSFQRFPGCLYSIDILRFVQDVLDVLRCSQMFSDDHRCFWIFSRYSTDVLSSWSVFCSHNICQ